MKKIEIYLAKFIKDFGFGYCLVIASVVIIAIPFLIINVMIIIQQFK